MTMYESTQGRSDEMYILLYLVEFGTDPILGVSYSRIRKSKMEDLVDFVDPLSPALPSVASIKQSGSSDRICNLYASSIFDNISCSLTSDQACRGSDNAYRRCRSLNGRIRRANLEALSPPIHPAVGHCKDRYIRMYNSAFMMILAMSI